jgi:8-oxo-dGTP pyrophosphatase MutT (NUDIX family)
LRSAAPSASSSEADALAARRARADRETSAGGIVYRVQNGEALFLIIRDSYRNWGFPKGHLEGEELPDEAAIREVQEETGLAQLQLDGVIETIDWFFRFRGRLVHKVCHFYLMRTESTRTVPQREEGITACRWARFEEATRLISYANARSVLSRANAMVLAGSGELADAGPRAGANAGANTHPHTGTNAADAARPTR